MKPTTLSHLERLWLAVTFAEAGEPDQALALLALLATPEGRWDTADPSEVMITSGEVQTALLPT
ncbi:MAG: hypothetical protein H7834_09875 [Magnetococcus sp. YQC-9]